MSTEDDSESLTSSIMAVLAILSLVCLLGATLADKGFSARAASETVTPRPIFCQGPGMFFDLKVSMLVLSCRLETVNLPYENILSASRDVAVWRDNRVQGLQGLALQIGPSAKHCLSTMHQTYYPAQHLICPKLVAASMHLFQHLRTSCASCLLASSYLEMNE